MTRPLYIKWYGGELRSLRIDVFGHFQIYIDIGACLGNWGGWVWQFSRVICPRVYDTPYRGWVLDLGPIEFGYYTGGLE